MARLGLQVRAIGKADFRKLLRVILINVADVLDDDLSDDRLKGVLAFMPRLAPGLAHIRPIR